MSRILTALIIFFLASIGVFLYFFVPSSDLEYSLYNSLPYYAPFAAFCLMSSLIFKSRIIFGNLIISILLYASLICAGEIVLREFLLPRSNTPPLQELSAQEFGLKGSSQSKKGIIIETPQGIYLFGELLKTPTRYLGRNFSFISNEILWESGLISIEENKILALNTRKITKNRTNIGEGVHELQLPFALEPIYTIWGEKDPQQLKLKENIFKFELFKNRFLHPYRKTLALTYGRYIGTFLLLIFIGMFSLSALNSLTFKGIGVFSSIIVLIFILPTMTLVHHYVIEMINSAVNSLL